jgi:hypothetical protein
VPGNALEGVLHVNHLRCSPVEGDTHHVEAEGFGLGLPLYEVLLGEGANRCLFAGGHRLEWVAEGRAGAQLHLDKDEGIAVAQDQVELAVTGAVVALDEGVAALLEILEGEILAPPPGGPFLQAPTPA